MKLLILGGKRFLGRYLVEAAQELGHEVTLFNRGRENPSLFPNIENLIGDRNGNLEALKGREWDAVIDTCGFVPRAVRETTEILSGASQHYTFISSVSVYADLSKIGIDENHPVIPMSKEKAEEITKGTAGPIYNEYYGPLKYLCEQAAEEVMPNKTLSIRAGLIVGPNDYSDRFSYWVQRVAKGGEVLTPGNPNKQIQFIDVRDLSEWLIRMIENKKTGVFNATGPDNELTMGDLLETCKSALQSDARLTWVSEDFLTGHEVAFWSEMPLWIPDHLNEPGFLSVNIQKAIDNGLTFRPLSHTIRDTLDWELSRPLDIERKAGMQPSKEMNLLQRWHKSIS
ncbi:SDR family oxidoreductase [Paenibacillus sediminis]|uniref:2'-hydroxyisoflavone reductase n=1 Tax=Paenibacillus sediminis TaxID=664909 RepID=A0ABS4H648_9BACL|nr:SDR family oxidoreductase [Paenibacillus sediminis]MBP1937997.1 2'-hydroxyisoflavone reductase [Paenibacillus sediminis]